MRVILPCIPDPPDIVLQGEVIGDASVMDWQLALAKAVPVSDIPALIPLIAGEVIGQYKMTGFPVPRAMIGQHPWYGIQPRMTGPMRQAGGRLEQVIIGSERRLDPYTVFVDRTQAWQATVYEFDKSGLILVLTEPYIIGALEPTDEGVVLPQPLFPEDPVVLIPRGAVYRSGLAKRITSVTLPVTFGRNTMLDSFTETTMRWFITGVTRDSAMAALGNCTVMLMRADEVEVNPDILGNPIEQTQVSDGSGNFEFQVPAQVPHQLTGYLAGSPDRAGITRNDVMPTDRG